MDSFKNYLENHLISCQNSNTTFQKAKKIEKQVKIEKVYFPNISTTISQSADKINDLIKSKDAENEQNKKKIELELKKLRRNLKILKMEIQKKKTKNPKVAVEETDEKNNFSNDFQSSKHKNFQKFFTTKSEIPLEHLYQQEEKVSNLSIITEIEKDKLIKEKEMYDILDQKQFEIQQKINKWNQFYGNSSNTFSIEYKSNGEVIFQIKNEKIEHNEIPYQTMIEKLTKKLEKEKKEIEEEKIEQNYCKSRRIIELEKLLNQQQ